MRLRERDLNKSFVSWVVYTEDCVHLTWEFCSPHFWYDSSLLVIFSCYSVFIRAKHETQLVNVEMRTLFWYGNFRRRWRSFGVLRRVVWYKLTDVSDILTSVSFYRLHGAPSRKTVIFIPVSVRTWNLTDFYLVFSQSSKCNALIIP
jgi:hypothetical protein